MYFKIIRVNLFYPCHSCSGFFIPINPGSEKEEETPPFNSPIDGGKDAIIILSMNYNVETPKLGVSTKTF